MSKNKNAYNVLIDTFKSFELERNTVIEEINWVLSSDDSFHIDRENFKTLIKKLAIIQSSMEQVEFFLSQITQKDGLDSEGSDADSSGS